MIENLKGPKAADQYQNLTPIAKGGMGTVYLAYDIANERKVAIKTIDIINEDYEHLLEQEGKISLQLSSKNLVSTLCTGKSNVGEHRFFYLVQNYYSNGNLRKYIRPNITLPDAMKMFGDLLNGLSAIHTLIVHRDLKPENILIADDGSLLIADFGLAKFVAETTRTKTFKNGGTYPYMSPECWLNEPNTKAMDIYSLGIIFFEILAGQLPANLSTENEWRDFHLFASLPDISKFRADIPVKLKQIIAKMTQKRAHERFNSVDEIIAALNLANQQLKSEEMEIDRLAGVAHRTSEQITADILRKKEKAEKDEAFQKLLAYHIDELFKQVSELVTRVNARLEDPKIRITDSGKDGNPFSRHFELTFAGKSLKFQFYPPHIFPNYEEKRADTIRQIQIQRQGFVWDFPQPSKMKNLNMVLLGMVTCNRENSSLKGNFGFNVILCKDNQELYGTWYIAMFHDTGLSGHQTRQSYALNADDFLQDFENCFIYHTRRVDYHKLEESDLIRAIEEILSH